MKPVATGSVVVRVPMVDVEEEVARTLGADQSTTIERTAEGEYRVVTRAGLARVVQQFTLQPAGDAETTVEATIYVRPSWLGWMVRRVMRRRRLEQGVQSALERMARAASGEPEPEPEFGPEDFADDHDHDHDADPAGGHPGATG
jgi:hypothetical protein